MIAVLTGPAIATPLRVTLPAAPVVGETIEIALADVGRVVVRDRRFVVPLDGESEIVLRVERAEEGVMLDEKTLAADEALCAAATPGPWEGDGDKVRDDDPMPIAHILTGEPEPDSRFIARSRNALPEYIAEVRRLRAALIDIRDNARWEDEVDAIIARVLEPGAAPAPEVADDCARALLALVARSGGEVTIADADHARVPEGAALAIHHAPGLTRIRVEAP